MTLNNVVHNPDYFIQGHAIVRRRISQ